MIAKRCLVSGRVQGVFYRASTQQKARALGVTGFARNLSDGRVEVLAVGELAGVEALVKWLWEGSPASHVISMQSSDLSLSELGELPRQFLTD
jgi:acylphosphatase